MSEKKSKRARTESVEEIIPLKSTITIGTPTEQVEKEPQTKKPKTKAAENQVMQPTVIQTVSEPPIVQSTVQETISEPPIALPSTNGRIRELRSKTPAWKAQQPVAQGNTQGNISRFSYSFEINHSR